MDELQTLREWLSKQPLTPLAQATGLNRRTLQRIATDNYNVKVDKYLILKAAMERSLQEQATV
ncbi:hypothetical protein R75461_01164 [Paraburkholderia nemoris]|uniref:hypothetical protein n=1 Tax=Paraburkholderia nemoris TaxID=2793076 RepID=UPI001B2C9624|nr:hypothetical protein [Paraburkholderia nemoris]CAE6713345.1 hypothetical protein R75461_01164 [Paraburkholderia nemoris]